MEKKTLDPIVSWLRDTDLVEAAWRCKGQGFDMKLEGSSSIPQTQWPASRIIPIVSPGVGIFRFNRPGKPKKAQEGAAVAVGDELGIVETGGKPREVLAGVAGRLLKVIIEDGKAVEYGQILFLISL